MGWGVPLGPGLQLDKEGAVVPRSAFCQLPWASQPQPFLGREELATVVHDLATCRLNCCNVALRRDGELQLVQKAAALVLPGVCCGACFTVLKADLHRGWVQSKGLARPPEAQPGLELADPKALTRPATPVVSGGLLWVPSAF